MKFNTLIFLSLVTLFSGLSSIKADNKDDCHYAIVKHKDHGFLFADLKNQQLTACVNGVFQELKKDAEINKTMHQSLGILPEHLIPNTKNDLAQIALLMAAFNECSKQLNIKA